MKNLLKMTAIAALTFTSISAFAASQQAEEVKKFQAWEETASKKLEASFDAVGAASATSNATETEAAVAAFDKQAAENVAELEALGIKSEEVSPVVGKYKEFINAEKEVIHLILTQVKSPTAENATKIPELAAKMSDKGDELGKLVEQLEEKFPAE
ncbi:MAG: preprotein translocase [Haemophilus parainfluenzae]|jgi:raw score 13.86|nr:preprotein translocase [Haemophilus parainfluenzae]